MNNHDRLRQSATWLTASRVWWAVALSVAIAVGVVVVSAIQGASWSELRAVEVDWGWLVVAMSLVVLRDLGYILRLMVLGRGSLNAGKATSSIALWELASALTPSVVGGSAVASFILHRNGLTWGRSLAVVMTTALLDESFFLLAVPATALIAGWGPFFPEGAAWIQGSVATVFAGGYAFMMGLALCLSTALFWAPHRVQSILKWTIERTWLRRWHARGTMLAADLLDASVDLRSMSMGRWMAAFGATVMSWLARFLTLNALLMAFVAPLLSGQTVNQLELWARQLSMWTVLLISPTPGSSGLAELALPTFVSDALPMALTATVWAAVILTWRGLTYHLYLFLGGTLMPFWIAYTSGSAARKFVDDE